MGLARPLLLFVGSFAKIFMLLRVGLSLKAKTLMVALFTITATSSTVCPSTMSWSTTRLHTSRSKIGLVYWLRSPSISRSTWRMVIDRFQFPQWINTPKCTLLARRSITLMWRCRSGRLTAPDISAHGQTSDSRHSYSTSRELFNFMLFSAHTLMMDLGFPVLRLKHNR